MSSNALAAFIIDLNYNKARQIISTVLSKRICKRKRLCQNKNKGRQSEKCQYSPCQNYRLFPVDWKLASTTAKPTSGNQLPQYLLPAARDRTMEWSFQFAQYIDHSRCRTVGQVECCYQCRGYLSAKRSSETPCWNPKTPRVEPKLMSETNTQSCIEVVATSINGSVENADRNQFLGARGIKANTIADLTKGQLI